MNDLPEHDGDREPSQRLTPAEERARGRRNVALAMGLVAFVALVFLLTLVRLKENVAARPF